uniref:Ribonuclease H-like domain-containing protein n=1 Tax=Tanacetum cinerariifolium TaxID=118510 RepID=A0A6L2MHT3_TANCI|nr:ribonuclease H-like domain-containing protein [Tanacetum cinerariifolium]
MANAKEMWEAIKSRFSGNDESKKMQKYLLKHQFEGFSMSSSEGLHKGYDRFQTLLSQLEIHGAGVSHEDANQKFLSAPQLDCDDLKQINDDDLEEMDLKWKVAMNSMRIKKFHKRTRRNMQFDTRDTIGFDKTKVKCFNCHKIGHFARDCRAKGNQDSRRRDVGTMETKLKTMVEDLHIRMIQKLWLPLMERLLTARLKKVYDEQRDKLGDAGIEITAYTLTLKKSVFMNKECDLENKPVNDRYAEGMHAVLPPMTGNYMPSGPDVEIDYSKFTYGPKQTSVDELDAKTCENASSKSDSSVETTTYIPDPVDNTLKVVCTPKVWTDAPIIVEYESDSDDDSRMAKQAALTKSKEKFTGQQAHRPVWNNVKRFNHQNKFVSSVVLTKTGKIPVNAARQNFSRQAALTSTASKVNTARPFMNETRPTICLYKSHSPNKRPFHNKTTQKNTFVNNKVNTVNTSLSAVKGNRDTTIKASANCNWRNKRHSLNKDNPHKALKDKGIINSGCSRHMTGNKAYLADYQDFKGGSTTNYKLPKTFPCHVTILNTIDQLGKFYGKSDSGFLVGYFLNSKAFRVYNLETKRVEENMHVTSLENKPNVVGKGHAWMFDLDYLTNSMNYEPVSLENQANKSAGPKKANHSACTKANDDQDANSEEIDLHDEHFLLHVWSTYSTTVKSS